MLRKDNCFINAGSVLAAIAVMKTFLVKGISSVDSILSNGFISHYGLLQSQCDTVNLPFFFLSCSVNIRKRCGF